MEKFEFKFDEHYLFMLARIMRYLYYLIMIYSFFLSKNQF